MTAADKKQLDAILLQWEYESLFRPLTAEEADAELARHADASPLSEEEIERIMNHVTSQVSRGDNQ